jgi:hypothetical protein
MLPIENLDLGDSLKYPRRRTPDPKNRTEKSIDERRLSLGWFLEEKEYPRHVVAIIVKVVVLLWFGFVVNGDGHGGVGSWSRVRFRRMQDPPPLPPESYNNKTIGMLQRISIRMCDALCRIDRMDHTKGVSHGLRARGKWCDRETEILDSGTLVDDRYNIDNKKNHFSLDTNKTIRFPKQRK